MEQGLALGKSWIEELSSTTLQFNLKFNKNIKWRWNTREYSTIRVETEDFVRAEDRLIESWGKEIREKN